MNCSRWTMGVLAACAAATCGAATVTAQARLPATPPTLNWTACGEFFPGIECATVIVPLDYDQPRGATTQIALARVPAADQANKIGSVFLNPGGPGGSGVDLVLFGFGDYLAALLDGRFDIVGFDPRGVGASSPMHCFDSRDERDEFLGDQPVFPYKQAQKRSFYETFRAFGKQCVNHADAITRHMSTADVVRDMDLLRQAVGDSRLTYLGFSYGTYLGNTYANMFPNKVRALAIDGVLDPRLWSSGWQVASDRVATDHEFREFLRLCDAAGEACELSGPEGAATRYAQLANSLRAAPLVFDDGSEYSYNFLIADTAGSMYSPEYWGGPFGDGAYFAALADAVLGDRMALQRAAEIRKAIQDRQRNAPRRAEYDNSFDAYYGNNCADAPFPATFADFNAVGTFAASGSTFGPFWWWGNASCSGWPVSPDRYAGPWATRTSAPVLVVGNYFDGVTDYEGAVASSELLKNSRLLTYAGWGHTAFGRSECVTQYVVDYLRDGALPPVGTVCPANPNPFLPVLQLRRSSVAPRAPMIGLAPTRPGSR